MGLRWPYRFDLSRQIPGVQRRTRFRRLRWNLRVRLELRPTAITFERGHRFRLEISSSNFPRYDVNRNTGAALNGGSSFEIAEKTLYHDYERSTHMELPLVP